MPDRICCINPHCRRTFKRLPEYPEDFEMICAKCWRLLPIALTRRYRALWARYRRIERLVKRKRKGVKNTSRQYWRMRNRWERLRAANWAAIHWFFYPVEKPAGIEAFLEEMGFNK